MLPVGELSSRRYRPLRPAQQASAVTSRRAGSGGGAARGVKAGERDTRVSSRPKACCARGRLPTACAAPTNARDRRTCWPSWASVRAPGELGGLMGQAVGCSDGGQGRASAGSLVDVGRTAVAARAPAPRNARRNNSRSSPWLAVSVQSRRRRPASWQGRCSQVCAKGLHLSSAAPIQYQ